MEFVTRREAPQELTDNMDEWNRPWVEYYNKLKDDAGNLLTSTKPKTSYWLRDGIREPLMADFKNNCGYCGCLISKPWQPTDEFIAGKGDVDHLRAKSKYSELTYNWLNYIWSCKACNQIKGSFDDKKFPIFNPCLAEDCCKLGFISDIGSYELSPTANNDTTLIARLENTVSKTLLNAVDTCSERRDQVTFLAGYFKSINTLLDIDEELPEKIIERVRDVIQEEINNHISRIKLTLKSKSYKSLISCQYKKLCEKYNNVSILLNDN